MYASDPPLLTQMSTKTDSGKSRFRAKLAAAIKALLSGLRKRTALEIGFGVLITIVLSLLLLRYERSDVPLLVAGGIADSTIVAPVDLKIEDPTETNKRREQAVAATLPVFDHVPRASRDARNSIERLFAVGRDPSFRGDHTALLDAIDRESGLILDNEELDILAKHRFNAEL